MKKVSQYILSRALLIPILLLFSLSFTSCKSLEEYYYRDARIHERISSLNLGMTQKEAMDIIQYQPDFINKEALIDGMRQVFIYRGSYNPHGWIGESTPTVYRLVFENNILVAIDSDKDYEQIRINDQRRFEQARKEAEERRTAAIIEAQKKKEEKKKSK